MVLGIAQSNMFMVPIIFLFPVIESKIIEDSPVFNENPSWNGGKYNTKSGKVFDTIKSLTFDDKIDNYSELDKYALHSFRDILLYSFILKELKKNMLTIKQKKYTEMANQMPSINSMFQGCSNETYPSSTSNNIQTFKINLDLKPEVRWKEVMEHKKLEIKRLADFFEFKFGKKFMGIVDTYISWLHKSLPEEYFLELQGMAKATGLTIGRVTLYNLFYEFFSVCTSIIVEGEDGKIYHGRNLDFGLFMGWDVQNHTWYITELLRPLIIKVDFYKSKSKIYSAATYAGYTGILTAVKKGKFSLTIDERFIIDGGYVGIAEWILGRRDMSWLGLLTRQVLESADSYDDAQKLLASTNLVAPVYFILAGSQSQQGCIITRSRSKADIWTLGNRYPEQDGDWYLIETNFDHWETTPFWDKRRHYGIQCMEQIGRKDPLSTLYSVLSTRPVFNKETTLTALMDVAEGRLDIWERDCKDPCWPL